MIADQLVARLMEALVAGDRPAARRVVARAFAEGMPPSEVLTDLCWPAHESLEQTFRADQMSLVSYHLATRLLRTIVDQVGARLDPSPSQGLRVIVACGPSQNEEIAAQMTADLLEAAGCAVIFTGGGVPADEIMAQVHELKPDVLLLFAAAASDLPGIRVIVDELRTIGAAGKTRIVVGGGVFNRAEGLAQEIGIEAAANTPDEIVDLITRRTRVAGRIFAGPASAPAPSPAAGRPTQKAEVKPAPVVKVRRRAA